jgi:hypothetical protein
MMGGKFGELRPRSIVEMHPPESLGDGPVPHHTKDKGDLGVLKAQADMASQGWMILHPMTEHAPFDIVIYKPGTFRRVQVRYRSLTDNGCLEVSLRTAWNDRHGTHMAVINRDEVDIVCVYCPETDQCYYFNMNLTNTTQLNLRVRPTDNRQFRSACVHFAENYRKVPED